MPTYEVHVHDLRRHTGLGTLRVLERILGQIAKLPFDVIEMIAVEMRKAWRPRILLGDRRAGIFQGFQLPLYRDPAPHLWELQQMIQARAAGRKLTLRRHAGMVAGW